MANECRPLFRPGAEVTALATADVTGGRFVKITATRDATTGLVKVGPATAGVKPFGVAAADFASGATGTVIRDGILFVAAAGAITAGAQVEITTAGKVITLASGVAVGTALETGADNADVLIALDI